ncbi:transferase, partial [Streptomyces sp. SID89]|nr:transferase [Streptomyces sp. SID89]
RPAHRLPLAVDAALRPRPGVTLLWLRLHEMYGQVAAAGPRTLKVEWRHRESGHTAGRATVPLVRAADGTWSARAAVDL